jgi:hypothetical protein
MIADRFMTAKKIDSIDASNPYKARSIFCSHQPLNAQQVFSSHFHSQVKEKNMSIVERRRISSQASPPLSVAIADAKSNSKEQE